MNGHRDYIIKAVLHGLTGPIDGRKYYADVMIPMGTNDDEWVASVASYVRQSFGNTGGFVTPADVARVRAETAPGRRQWDVDELAAALPAPLVNDGWTSTASHNASAASRALSLQSWNSGAPQTARHVVPGRTAEAGRADRAAVRVDGRRVRDYARSHPEF